MSLPRLVFLAATLLCVSIVGCSQGSKKRKDVVDGDKDQVEEILIDLNDPKMFPTSAEEILNLDAQFDKTMMTPLKLLEDFYQEHQFVFIGIATHNSPAPYSHLTKFLNSSNDFSNLKYIILERHGETDEMHKIASEGGVTALENFLAAQDPDYIKNAVCVSREWAFSLKNFTPVITELRNREPSFNTLVRAIDGVKLGTDRGPDRERLTADNFIDEILSDLEPSDKVVVVYHMAHLITNLRKCEGGECFWLGRVFDRIEGMRERSALVFFDQNSDVYGSKGNTKLMVRQQTRHAKMDFAVKIETLSNHITLSGPDLYMDGSNLIPLTEPQVKMTSLFDGVIWSHNPGSFFTASHYFPNFCK